MAFVAISLNAAHEILRLKRHSRVNFPSKKMKNNCDERGPQCVKYFGGGMKTCDIAAKRETTC